MVFFCKFNNNNNKLNQFGYLINYKVKMVNEKRFYFLYIYRFNKFSNISNKFES